MATVIERNKKPEINTGVMEMKVQKSTPPRLLLLLLIFILVWGLLAEGTVGHLSEPCDWSMQPPAEFKADLQCLRSDAGWGGCHSVTAVKLQTGLLLMQPVWHWSPLAPLNSHLIPLRVRPRWLFAATNPEQETRPPVHSGVLIPTWFSTPSSSPSSVLLRSLLQPTVTSDLEQCS